jgi:hypothetical protein
MDSVRRRMAADIPPRLGARSIAEIEAPELMATANAIQYLPVTGGPPPPACPPTPPRAFRRHHAIHHHVHRSYVNLSERICAPLRCLRFLSVAKDALLPFRKVREQMPP